MKSEQEEGCEFCGLKENCNNYKLAIKEVLAVIDNNLKDIEYTFNTLKDRDKDDDGYITDEQEHINQLIGRREALTELKEAISTKDRVEMICDNPKCIAEHLRRKGYGNSTVGGTNG